MLQPCRRRTKYSFHSGFTIAELLIAMTVLAIIIPVVLRFTLVSLQHAARQRDAIQSLEALANLAEIAGSLPFETIETQAILSADWFQQIQASLPSGEIRIDVSDVTELELQSSEIRAKRVLFQWGRTLGTEFQAKHQVVRICLEKATE
ncbi:MAG: type II secretion system protein [Planctomycetales bacterium]|nr:type II secretion system protein [Planctomycetales bacterium]